MKAFNGLPVTMTSDPVNGMIELTLKVDAGLYEDISDVMDEDGVFRLTTVEL